VRVGGGRQPRGPTARARRHLAARCLWRPPDADQGAHQRTLPGAARTDDTERFARLESETRPATIGIVPPGATTVTCSSKLRAARGSVVVAPLGTARASASGVDESAPVRDGGFDRSERATHDDRSGDHGAGGQFPPDHEIGGGFDRSRGPTEALRPDTEGNGEADHCSINGPLPLQCKCVSP
jgi:hypothetical protein